MKQYFKKLTDFFRIKNNKVRIINYLISGLSLIYLGILIYPYFLFEHTLKYKTFNIHSTQPISANIQKILDEAELKLSVSEINDKGLTHNIFLCNNLSLFTFLAPFSRLAFACNYPIINNIFVANCNIDKNEAYKYDDKDPYIRQLDALISHETTHTLIEKKIGLWKSRKLEGWKNEGYCDFIGNGKTFNLREEQEFLKINKTNNKPGTIYHKYYIAVNYLMHTEKMFFENMIKTDLSFEAVLKKVELTESVNIIKNH